MRKTYPTARKLEGSGNSRAKHLRKTGKRQANKGTRAAFRQADISLEPGMMSSVWAARDHDYAD